jgi:hypothetical protein
MEFPAVLTLLAIVFLTIWLGGLFAFRTLGRGERWRENTHTMNQSLELHTGGNPTSKT